MLNDLKIVFQNLFCFYLFIFNTIIITIDVVGGGVVGGGDGGASLIMPDSFIEEKHWDVNTAMK